MRIQMLRDRIFVVPGNRSVSFSYKAGHRYTVKRAWAEAMIADGYAQEVRAPSRSRRGRKEPV